MVAIQASQSLMGHLPHLFWLEWSRQLINTLLLTVLWVLWMSSSNQWHRSFILCCDQSSTWQTNGEWWCTDMYHCLVLLVLTMNPIDWFNMRLFFLCVWLSRFQKTLAWNSRYELLGKNCIVACFFTVLMDSPTLWNAPFSLWKRFLHLEWIENLLLKAC